MFYSLTGTVVRFDASSVAVSCGGVAFNCQTSMNTLKQVAKTGEEVTVYTYLNVREDALDLFGFSTERELECFKLLISISGIGPKMALAILSVLNPDELSLAIASGDYKVIATAQGIGAKKAQRIVMELKDKVASGNMAEIFDASSAQVASVSSGGNTAEAISALTMLGYSQSEAATAVSKTDKSLSVEEIIKQALKQLSKQV
ncbi:MAG: Holliday junction branch migration protein RuvA [Clostridiales bacterium]|nr:Holliday junction branch migration protein RuvA [Clostridiales bacterium]